LYQNTKAMKQIVILIGAIMLLGLAGCEKDTTATRYKYIVTTDADSAYIMYTDSTGVIKEAMIYDSWRYSWTNAGRMKVSLYGSTNCWAQALNLFIYRNDTLVAGVGAAGPITNLYVTAYN
jgi:acyl-CoA synthetase (AMP-forming)/AMP-acid ligase II